MKASISVALAFAATIPTVNAIDDFGVQVNKAMHEDTSLRHDVYTVGESAGLWGSECPWFQKPSVSLRFNTIHQDRPTRFFPGGSYIPGVDSELYSPLVAVGFETIGGVNAGLAYSHAFLVEEETHPSPRPFAPRRFELEGDRDSVGVYLSKQWNCGLKVGGTWSYSTAEQRFGDREILDFNTMGASGSLGFARSFGEKKFGRNVFVDTSANFLYQTEEDAWYFVWMAKLGHNICERFAVYGLFNLFYDMEYEGQFGVPQGFAGYRPYLDDTWGEAGGGVQVRLCHGLNFMGEATIPVLDEGFIAEDAFQLRGGLNWSF